MAFYGTQPPYGKTIDESYVSGLSILTVVILVSTFGPLLVGMVKEAKMIGIVFVLLMEGTVLLHMLVMTTIVSQAQ